MLAQKALKSLKQRLATYGTLLAGVPYDGLKVALDAIDVRYPSGGHIQAMECGAAQ